MWQKNLTNPIVDDIISKLVGNAAIAWGHCAPSACDQGDFWNNYQVGNSNFRYSIDQIFPFNRIIEV